MKILLVQDHLRAGGAARAAGRWAQLLRGAGHTVTQAAGDEDGSGAIQLSGKPPRGIGRLVELIAGRQGFRARRLARQFDQLLGSAPWDAVWFHNLAGGEKWGWAASMIPQARERAATVWTLHDMWALGDSSESYWEERSAVGSGRLKGAGGKNSRVEKVCGADGKFPVTVTAPSGWLAEVTRRITGHGCIHLPNPMDLDLFGPGDQPLARKQLGLPETGLVVLAGADSLADPRKGFDLLLGAWEQVRPAHATLALFGRHGNTKPGQVYLGNLDSDARMAAAYRAADLYVHPARMENAPCTVQEALACGTPVLAFAVGGIPEMITHGKNGFLAKEVSVASLQEALALALADPSRLGSMRIECRRSAEDAWNEALLAQRFQKVAGRQ